MATALITGASKGIGKAMATKLAAQGYDLLLVARSEKLLSDLAQSLESKNGIRVHWIAEDLCKTESTDTILKKIKDNNLGIEILINNAGYGLWGRFDTLTFAEQYDMMSINMLTMTRLTHALLPMLKENKSAYILNVASTAAYQAVPTLSAYAASKSFVVLFTRALAYEMKGSPVSVSCLSPGPTETNFMHAAGMTTPEMIKRASRFNMTPERVADIALKGMFAGEKEIIPGFLNKVSVWMISLVPKFITEKIAAGLYE